ncbi:MAG: site-2 protease family protein, partial [Treponema sp.]|nr:site-2 protease family protein [Treponema sp.]
ILKKKIGAVEYRLGMFPIGGYCKMKGENEFKEAWEQNQNSAEPEKGTYLSASPLKRIFVHFMGPFFNVLFAVLVMSIIWGIGFQTVTTENRIVLLSDITPGTNPADIAGLKSGDRIIEINGKKISNYLDIQENIVTNAEKNLPIKVDRDGTVLALTVRPNLERSSGRGIIGIYNWTDPVIGGVSEGSPAALAGLVKGDRIISINGQDFPYTVKLIPIIDEMPDALNLEYDRNGRIMQTQIPVTYTGDATDDLGFYWEPVIIRHPTLNPISALVKGTAETIDTLVISVRSLSLLFRGVDLTQAVSGPIRITYMVGEVATEGFDQSIGTGISSMASFLSLISIALCIMNLLPLPILDGGMMILHAVEGIRRKPLHPKAIGAFQTVGVVLIFGLMIFAIFGDILFLVRR